MPTLKCTDKLNQVMDRVLSTSTDADANIDWSFAKRSDNPDLKINWLNLSSESGKISYLPADREERLGESQTPYDALGLRQKAKPAKVFRAVMPSLDEKNIIKLAEVWAAIIREMETEIDEERCLTVSGNDVRLWYDQSRYLNDRGQLGSSCMRYSSCYDMLELYEANPKAVKMAIVTAGASHGHKLEARCLLWTDTTGKLWHDRVYANSGESFAMMAEYLKSLEAADIYTDNSNDGRRAKVSVGLEKWDFDSYPYMDSFAWLSEGKLHTWRGEDGGRWHLKSTTPRAPQRLVQCEHCGSETTRERIVELATGGTASRDCCAVHSRVGGGWILREQAVLVGQEWVPESMAIRILMGSGPDRQWREVINTPGGLRGTRETIVNRFGDVGRAVTGVTRVASNGCRYLATDLVTTENGLVLPLWLAEEGDGGTIVVQGQGSSVYNTLYLRAANLSQATATMHRTSPYSIAPESVNWGALEDYLEAEEQEETETQEEAEQPPPIPEVLPTIPGCTCHICEAARRRTLDAIDEAYPQGAPHRTVLRTRVPKAEFVVDANSQPPTYLEQLNMNSLTISMGEPEARDILNEHRRAHPLGSESRVTSISPTGHEHTDVAWTPTYTSMTLETSAGTTARAWRLAGSTARVIDRSDFYGSWTTAEGEEYG